MGLFKRDKEKDRFYLLPGQGGRALREKNRRFLIWSLAAALVVAGALGTIMYYANKAH